MTKTGATLTAYHFPSRQVARKNMLHHINSLAAHLKEAFKGFQKNATADEGHRTEGEEEADSAPSFAFRRASGIKPMKRALQIRSFEHRF